MTAFSKPMRDAMMEIQRQMDPETQKVRSLSAVCGVTPGTLRALERRGIITCDRFYATENIAFTVAGLDALAQLP